MELFILVKPISILPHVLTVSIPFGTKFPTFLNISVLLQCVGISAILLVFRFSIMLSVILNLTLFRLGFFGQSVTGGGGGGLLGPPPLSISETNNARVMKFTHNDHFHTKKPNTQF